MNPEVLGTNVRRAGTLAAGLCVLLAAVILLNRTHSGRVFWALSVANVVHYIGLRQLFRKEKYTVRWYFHVVSGTLVSLSISVGLLVLFLVTEATYNNAIGWKSIIILGLIAVHQVWRGARLVFRKWKGPDDILVSLSRAKTSVSRFAGGYDFTFFVIVSMVASVLGALGGDRLPVLVTATLFVLSIPYLLGLVAALELLLHKHMPADERLPETILSS